MTPTIGLSALFVTPTTSGSGSYAWALAEALGESRPSWQFLLYLPRGVAPPRPLPPNVELRIRPIPAGSAPARWGWERSMLARDGARDGIDLLHSLNGTGPLRGAFARVVTVLDLIFEHAPADYPGLRRPLISALFRSTVAASDLVVTPSEHTRRDLLRTYRVEPDRVLTVPLGPGRPRSAAARGGAAPTLQRYGVSPPFTLTVSAGHHYKNLDGLARATVALRPRRPDLGHIVVGPLGRLEPQLRELSSRLSAPVTWAGWLETAELEALYEDAAVVLCPSLAEGFGLPLLEAFTRGTPVVASGAGPFREMGEDAALHADAEDPEAFADAIERVLSHPELAARLVAAGRRRVEALSWARCAEETAAAYERLFQSAAGERRTAASNATASARRGMSAR